MLREDGGGAKLAAVATWRDARCFSQQERAALTLAEGLVRSDLDVDDELYTSISAHFSEAELVELTAWICVEDFMSTFNRAFRIEGQGFCPVPLPKPD